MLPCTSASHRRWAAKEVSWLLMFYRQHFFLEWLDTMVGAVHRTSSVEKMLWAFSCRKTQGTKRWGPSGGSAMSLDRRLMRGLNHSWWMGRVFSKDPTFWYPPWKSVASEMAIHAKKSSDGSFPCHWTLVQRWQLNRQPANVYLGAQKRLKKKNNFLGSALTQPVLCLSLKFPFAKEKIITWRGVSTWENMWD